MHSVILYYVVQAQAAELHRQARRDAPARAANRAAAPASRAQAVATGQTPGAFAGPLAARPGR